MGKGFVVQQFCGGPEYIVRAMTFLRGALGKHLEVNQLDLTHVLVVVIVQVKVQHEVGPPRIGRFGKAVLATTHRNLL